MFRNSPDRPASSSLPPPPTPDSLLLSSLTFSSPIEPLDPSSVQTPLWSGSLLKRGHFVKSWKTRHVVLKGGLLAYYRSEAEEVHDEMNPRGCAVVTDVGRHGREGEFGLQVGGGRGAVEN